jgi:hypothetical protein
MFCPKCGTEIPDDSLFCRKCGVALNAAAPTTAVIPTPAQTQTNLNLGTIIFSAFSVLSLVVCLSKGIVPIYFGEAVLWGGIAWYWHRRKYAASQAATVIVLVGAVVVAAGEGYFVGNQGSKSRRRTATEAEMIIPSPSQSADPWEGRAKQLSNEQQSPANQGPTTPVAPSASKIKSNKRPRSGATPALMSPQVSCPDQLAPGVERTIVSLSTPERALLRASLEHKYPGAYLPYLLILSNGTPFCITSVAVSIIVEDKDTMENRTLNKTVDFSQPLAPGQNQESGLDSKFYFGNNGAYLITEGLVKKWDLGDIRGYAAIGQTGSLN